MDVRLPEIPKLVVRNPANEILFEEEISTLNELLRFAQQGIDPKDAVNTEVWTGRLAATLNDKYALPPEQAITPGQAFLLSATVVEKWKELTGSFFQGLR